MASAPLRRMARWPSRIASQSTQSGTDSTAVKNSRNGSGASGTLAMPLARARSNSGRICFMPAAYIHSTRRSIGSSATASCSPSMRHWAAVGLRTPSTVVNARIAGGTGPGRSGWRAGIAWFMSFPLRYRF